MSYAFRVRINRGHSDTLDVHEPTLDLPAPGPSQSVQLRAGEKDRPIKDCERLVIVGEGFNTNLEATKAGEHYSRALLRSLVRLRIGADFGDRAPKGGFTNYGLEWLEAQCGQRVLEDRHGLMVFPAESWPRFASLGSLTLIRGNPKDRFVRVFRRALETDYELTQKERVAFEMFNASFFQPSVDSMFLLRVIAVEALLEPRLRPGDALAHVDALIATTSAKPSLSQVQKDSLLGSLRFLRYESIRRAGMDLAESKLAGRTYQNRSPGQFFSDCYNVRSDMVHGHLPFPKRGEIAQLASSLELFVSDLLSGPLLDVT